MEIQAKGEQKFATQIGEERFMVVRTCKHKDKGEGSCLKDQHTLRSNKITSNEKCIMNKGRELWIQKGEDLGMLCLKFYGFKSFRIQ